MAAPPRDQRPHRGTSSSFPVTSSSFPSPPPFPRRAPPSLEAAPARAPPCDQRPHRGTSSSFPVTSSSFPATSARTAARPTMAASPEWPSFRVREKFFSYLQSKSHTLWPLSPVVLVDDPAAPFSHAGMKQFAPVFLGTAAPKSQLGLLRRACGSYKCIRAGGDHDNVGNDIAHHTLMEVLGCWSFGDYFKEDAIKFSWELLTEVYKLPTDRIYVTCYGGDEKFRLPPDTQSCKIWLKYLPKERVLPSSCKPHFWEMGDSGPCGPCSSIHIKDGSASLEIWHLVFIQFKKEGNGTFRHLPSKHVASVMSIERLTSILQNKRSSYDTDVFGPVLNAIHQCAGDEIQPYTGKVGSCDIGGIDMAYRLVADHTRTLSFAIADGYRFGNEGGGCLLKRMLGQVLHYGHKKLKTKQGFLTFLVNFFPELSDHEKIKDIIRGEEEMFRNTSAEVNGSGSSTDVYLTPVDLKPCIAWSCLKSNQEEEGIIDTMTELPGEAQVNCRVGTLNFSDRPYSTLFYGQGYMQSVIMRSVPDIPTEERGSSTSYSRKPLYASIYSPGCRARNSYTGNRFLQFLRGFKEENSQKLYYKGVVLSMICLDSTIMNVKFRHIKNQDSTLSAEICCFYESVRQDLDNAAMSFIVEFNSEFEAICSKKFTDFRNLTVCIEGLPEANSSITVADTTAVGRFVGLDLLIYIFKAHAAKRTWNGRFNLQKIFVKNGSEVEIRAPFCHKFTDDAALNDLIRYVDDFIPLFKLPKEGLPAFFSHLGKSLKDFSPPLLHFPDYLRRFQRFALTTLALKDSMRRSGLFSGLYRIRQTRRVRSLLKKILRSSSFEPDWRKEILLKQHPILKRVFNHNNNDAESGSQDKESDSQKLSNTPDGTLVYVRHTNEHGPDGPKEGESTELGGGTAAVEEDPIQLLSDLDLLSSHCLQEYLPEILEAIIFSENIPHELEIMLEEVFEAYNRPEYPITVLHEPLSTSQRRGN